MKLDLNWVTRGHPILRSLALIAVSSIATNLLVSAALVVAFKAISTQNDMSVSPLIDNFLNTLRAIELDPGLLVVVAIGILVASNNITAQLETSLLRRQLLVQASALKPPRERADKQLQAGYLSTLRPLYGNLFSFSSELPKFVVFLLAALVLFWEVLWLWLAIATLLVALLMRKGFVRGGQVFTEHKRVRKDSAGRAEALVNSLVSIESNAAVLPISSLLLVLALAISPFVASWLVPGALAGSDGSWIPVWVLLISSVTSLIRVASSLGLSVNRNGDYVVVGGTVQRNAK